MKKARLVKSLVCRKYWIVVCNVNWETSAICAYVQEFCDRRKWISLTHSDCFLVDIIDVKGKVSKKPLPDQTITTKKISNGSLIKKIANNAIHNVFMYVGISLSSIAIARFNVICVCIISIVKTKYI